MIGKAYISVFKFYDNKNHKMSFKKCPVLVVGQADAANYVILPISRVTNKANLDDYYDVEITPNAVPLMNLTQTSYIRTNKQGVVNIGELTKEIVDFRKEYADTYRIVIEKMEEFQKKLIKEAF